MATGVAAVWVPVEDMSRAVAFYRDALGFDVDQQNDDWSEVDANGVKIGLNGREKEGTHGEGGAVISFQPDDDIEQEVERLKAAGVTFTGEVSDHEWGRIAPFKDSEGNDLQFYAPPKN
jgi:predicted enzyme related to lactoylglutathione lyase